MLVGCCVKTSCATAAGVTLNPADVVASVLLLNCNVYPVPALLIPRRENVATPATAATVVIPESAPPTGFTLRVAVTSPVKLVIVWPRASCAATWTAGEIAAPAAVFVGDTVTLSRVGATATVKSELAPWLPSNEIQALLRFV